MKVSDPRRIAGVGKSQVLLKGNAPSHKRCQNLVLKHTQRHPSAYNEPSPDAILTGRRCYFAVDRCVNNTLSKLDLRHVNPEDVVASGQIAQIDLLQLAFLE